MKEKIKQNIFGFILGVICTTTIGVVAATVLASSVSYNPNPKSQTGAQTVSEALDELYTMAGVKYSLGSASENTTYNSIEELKNDSGSEYYGVFLKSNLTWSTKNNEYNQLINQQVCMEKNDMVECFNPDFTEANKNKMASFFGEGACSAENEGTLNERYSCYIDFGSCTIYSDSKDSESIVHCRTKDYWCELRSSGNSLCGLGK